MPELVSLASSDGRQIYRELYKLLRTEQQRSHRDTLRILWQVATGARSLREFGYNDITVRYRLGVFAGTRLWLEEIVSRYYYSTVLSFVYGGAAILLVVIGLRRFSSIITDTVVLLSVGLEALLLLLLFTVMFFSRADDTDPHISQLHDLLREIGEIGRDYAVTLQSIERATTAIEQLASQNARLAAATEDAVRAAVAATAPSPELLEHLQAVNHALEQLRIRIDALTDALGAIEHDRIEQAVRTELAALLEGRINERSHPASPGT
jgi:hypothetical protein